MRTNLVKRRLQAGEVVVGTWLSLVEPLAARFLARSGLQFLTVDLEHGSADWRDAVELLGAIADAGCTPIARVPSNRHDHIKRALDCGAHGIIVPMVNSVEEARAAVAAAKYPPVGTRSVGGSIAALNFAASSSEYGRVANDETLVLLQCEHITAVENFQEIFGIPGVDAVFVGPNDLAASMRASDGTPPTASVLQQTLDRILDAAKRLKVPVGLHCFSGSEARRRADAGWQFLAINTDLRMLLDGAAQALQPFVDDLTRDQADASPY